MKKPAEQLVHTVADAAEKEPAAQSVLAVIEQNEPAAQATQAERPATEANSPAEQLRQTVLDAAE